MNNSLLEILNEIKSIHEKKAQDYTTSAVANPYENFIRAGEVGSWFPKGPYNDFGCLIGTKLARIGVLLQKETRPSNESLDDSMLDLVTYCALMYAYYRDNKLSTENCQT